jgi:anti-sigma factor ChrR (cupin superfamily)
VTVKGQTSAEVKSAKRASGDQVFRLRITIEPRRIVVEDRASGVIVDDYTHLGTELTSGRFGFQKGVRLVAGAAR